MNQAQAKDEPIAQEDDAAAPVETVTPVVVEMGKLRKKKLKALKNGDGPLMDEVVAVLEEVAAELGEEASGKTFVPVIIAYELKPRKKKRTIVLPF